jgi:hypothetical protein
LLGYMQQSPRKKMKRPPYADGLCPIMQAFLSQREITYIIKIFLKISTARAGPNVKN